LASIGCHRLGCELRDKVADNIKLKQQQQQQKEARKVERTSNQNMKYEIQNRATEIITESKSTYH
jgi:hypothetical protein